MGTHVPVAHLNDLFLPPEGGPTQYDGTSEQQTFNCTTNNPGHSPERVREEDVDRIYERSRKVR
jgi:hypothetical protein